jgi:hypothetical protein
LGKTTASGCPSTGWKACATNTYHAFEVRGIGLPCPPYRFSSPFLS